MPELLSDWLIYLTVLHMIGWSKLNERLPDMTLNRTLLDVINKLKKRYNKHVIPIRLLPERSPTFECGLVSGCITTFNILYKVIKCWVLVLRQRNQQLICQ